MRNHFGLAAAILAAALLGCASTSDRTLASASVTSPVVASKAVTAEERKISIAKFFDAYRLTLFSPGQQCQGADCPVLITLQTVKVGGEDYCFATLPEALTFKNTDPGNQPKTITWTLDTDVLLGRPVEFHLDSGILKVDDAKGQLEPDNHRTTTIVYKAKNKHKEKAEASYVPVIIWRKTRGLPQLCGTGDPKIVNE